ncbi:MAG: hypothetical protein IJK23_10015 [Clostridia bacterium]|nr:hypothetical protein [Clostridia bacterium]
MRSFQPEQILAGDDWPFKARMTFKGAETELTENDTVTAVISTPTDEIELAGTVVSGTEVTFRLTSEQTARLGAKGSCAALMCIHILWRDGLHSSGKINGKYEYPLEIVRCHDGRGSV